MKQILLNKSHGQESINVSNSLSLEISSKQRMFNGGNASGTINHYQIYLDERNNTKQYKLFCVVNPFMSNVLFNMFTEITSNYGGTDCFLLGDKKLDKHGDWENGARVYSSDKGITRYEALKDTEYSHPNLGNFTYHCGMDIFNNHILRGEGFFGVKKSSDTKNSNLRVFNTIEDYLVYSDGTVALHDREDISKESTGKKENIPTHLYNHENLLSFQNTFIRRLKEENGWLGFYNKPYANIYNHSVFENGNLKDITINKVINNRNACEFIDMYPDRSLFSLLPKVNEKYDNREEYNWDWKLTYPFRKRYFNVDEFGIEQPDKPYDFFEKDKGLKVIWHMTDSLILKGSSTDFLKIKNGASYDYLITRDKRNVFFRTKCKHGLKSGDIVRVKADGKNDFSCRVMDVGDVNGEMTKYYFSLSYDDLADGWGEERNYVMSNSIDCIRIPNNIFINKIVNGVLCDYYIRDFKVINGVQSVINKAGFATTIYGDPIGQIIFKDNIDVSKLVDHMGREISEIYLTIIKKNQGYKEWYLSGDTHPSYVEASHCFGEITSGFDFEMGENDADNYNQLKDYNVRMLYNIIGPDVKENFHEIMKIPFTKPQSLENDLQSEYIDVLCGDFVEFSPSRFEETVLEEVHHRFNTAQREIVNNSRFPFKCSALQYDEMKYDDNDFNDNKIVSFKIETKKGLTTDNSPEAWDSFCPEGYFYKPHYRIKLREFSENVMENYDMQIPVKIFDNSNKIKRSSNGLSYEIETLGDYFLTFDDKIILLYKNGSYVEGNISDGTNGRKIVFTCGELTDLNPWRIFIRNNETPVYSYYIPDGTGRRVWRNYLMESEISQDSDIYNRPFANGSIYLNNNINFYLRRQDPDGRYGLQYIYERVKERANFDISGIKKELPDVEYKTLSLNASCEL